MMTRCLTAGLLLILPVAVVAKDGRQCTPQEARAAEEGAQRVRNWAELHRAYEQFGHCDDGAIAEGYSDRVVEMLAHRWKTVLELDALVSDDPEFGEFVFRHIDESAAWSSTQKAERNATRRCPKQAAGLCSQVVRRVGKLRRVGEEMR